MKLKILVYLILSFLIIINSNCIMDYKDCIEVVENSVGYIKPQSIDFSNCTVESIRKHYHVNENNFVKTFLGEAYREVEYFEFQHSRKENASIKVWMFKENIIKVDIDFVIEGENLSEIIINDLGLPEIKLDYYFDVILMKEKVLVYPEKGIAINFGMSQNVIYSVSYFQSTSLDNYMKFIHSVEAIREFEE